MNDIDKKPLTFGKHKGKPPFLVASYNPGYIVWMYDTLEVKHCTLSLRNECKEIVDEVRGEIYIPYDAYNG